MSRRAVLGLITFLAGFTPAHAGPRQILMTDFVQDVWDSGPGGLPHPGVTGLMQSRDGYLWITTFAGVVRFDGVQFRAPDVTDERARRAAGDHVRSLLETPDGTMWFGTRREGVLRVKDGVAQVFAKKEGVAGTDVRALALTKDGTVWFGTADGLSALDTSGRMRTYLPENGLASKSIVTMFVDRDGTLWVGTTEFGLSRFDGTGFQTMVLEPKRPVAPEQAFGLPLRAVGAIARDVDGVLWAGTTAGIVRVPEDGSAPAGEAFPGAVNALFPARTGGLWASTGGGLGRLQGNDWRVYTSQEGLLNNGVSSVLEDVEGSLWVGTRIGLARLRPRLIRTLTQRDGLGNDSVSCVMEASNGDMWIGHRNGASRLSQGRWTAIGVEQGLPNAAVRTFAETPDGSIWIGTLQGLARYKDGRLKSYFGEGRPYSVRAMVVDGEGRLLLSTALGLDRLEGETLKRLVPLESLCDQLISNTLYLDREGTVWIGGGSSLTRIRDGKAECLNETGMLSRNDIRSVSEDMEGRLWIGSVGGLGRIVGGRRETLAGPAGPFAGIAIYSLLDDNRGSYWFNTPQGLFRVEKAKMHLYSDSALAPTIFRSFGTADGMDTPVGTGGGVPSAWRSRDGRLWFSTATGVAVVDPGRISPDTFRPPVYIEELLGDRQPVDLKPSPRLAAGTRDVELRFTMLSFIAPERVQYKYQLEGYDRGWVESGNRRAAYYTNLRPGRYRFRVIAANYSGVWNDTGAVVEFDLLPRLYERGVFQIACVLAVIGAVIAGYRWRLRRVRVHERELEERVTEAVAQIHTLKGLLPICASCKKIRDDSGYWNQMETYIHAHSGADFSHSICPECMPKLYPDYADARKTPEPGS
jgi:ligand-binding sensor domain-containing protein